MVIAILEAVIATAGQAVETALQLVELSGADRDRISELGRAAESALRVHRVLITHPIATSGWLAEKTTLTPVTVNKALEQLGVVREITGRKRTRLFSYRRYMDIMNRGTELPDR